MNVLYLTPTELRMLTLCRGCWFSTKMLERHFPQYSMFLPRLVSFGFLDVREYVMKIVVLNGRRPSHKRLSKMYRTSKLGRKQLAQARFFYMHEVEPVEAKLKRLLGKQAAMELEGML